MNSVINLDNLVSSFFVSTADTHPFLVLFFANITFLGSFSFIALFLIFISIYLGYEKKYRKFILPLWLSVVLSLFITYTLKFYFETLGPAGRNFTEFTPSFPSAHASGSMSFYGALYFIFKNKFKTIHGKNLFLIFTIIIIFLVGLSRLVLDVHFLSDVLVGYVVGASSLYLSMCVSRKLK